MGSGEAGAEAAAGSTSAGATVGGGGATSTAPTVYEPGAATLCDAALCDDFESGVLGSAPSGVWSVDVGGTSSVRSDDSRAFSGQRSLHFVMAEKQLAFIKETTTFPALEGGFYGRMMMYVVTASPDGVHWTMIEGQGPIAEALGGYDVQVRYGGQHQKRVMANYDTPGYWSGTDGVPQTDWYQHSATTMPEGRWTCIEWQFVSASDEMHFWLDGAPLDDLSLANGEPNCSGCGPWSGPKYESLRLGWQDYQAGGGAREFWIDDVGVGSERIGCPERADSSP